MATEPSAISGTSSVKKYRGRHPPLGTARLDPARSRAAKRSRRLLAAQAATRFMDTAMVEAAERIPVAFVFEDGHALSPTEVATLKVSVAAGIRPVCFIT